MSLVNVVKTGFEGASVTYLAKAVGKFPYIDQMKGSVTAKFSGDPAAYLAEHGDNDSNKRLLTNKVKKCSTCGKPNAFTLDRCNACGTSLVEIPISFSNNVFMGFVFGIEKGPFPFTISIRYQDSDFLVMDDLLALAPMHFNVIPTSQYAPDWRFLLRKPTEGLELVRNMLDCCATASKPFLENKEWCQKMLKEPHNFDLADIAAGFNYPPSQYQLHIQYIMPNMLPFQYAQFLKGVHFTYKRFFPVHYVMDCMRNAESNPLPQELLQEDTSIDDIIDHFSGNGIDYSKIHGSFMSNFKTLASKYANWNTLDFESSVVDVNGKAMVVTGSSVEEGVDFTALSATDKLVLQNYGRPYTNDGKPTGSYYSHAKVPSEVSQW